MKIVANILSRFLIIILGNLNKHDGDGWRERHKTKGLISKTMTLHVRYRFLYISLPSSAKQQREMTKFKVLCRTWTQDSEFFFSTWTVTPSLQSQLLDYSVTLDRLNELKLSRKSLKYLEVIFKVTFSLALPSWLLKFPTEQTTATWNLFVSYNKEKKVANDDVIYASVL